MANLLQTVKTIIASGPTLKALRDGFLAEMKLLKSSPKWFGQVLKGEGCDFKIDHGRKGNKQLSLSIRMRGKNEEAMDDMAGRVMRALEAVGKTYGVPVTEEGSSIEGLSMQVNKNQKSISIKFKK